MDGIKYSNYLGGGSSPSVDIYFLIRYANYITILRYLVIIIIIAILVIFIVGFASSDVSRASFIFY